MREPSYLIKLKNILNEKYLNALLVFLVHDIELKGKDSQSVSDMSDTALSWDKCNQAVYFMLL